jgi:hypothetical protein
MSLGPFDLVQWPPEYTIVDGTLLLNGKKRKVKKSGSMLSRTKPGRDGAPTVLPVNSVPAFEHVTDAQDLPGPRSTVRIGKLLTSNYVIRHLTRCGTA